MAYPFLFESTFENGSNAEWDSETDTGSLLDFPHYSALTRTDVVGSVAPFRGAYCMRIVAGDTNDHTLIEGDMDIADAGTAYARFYLLIGKDFTATANDDFNIFELQQAGGTVECSMGLRVTAATGAVQIGIGDGTAAASYVTSPLSKGVWHCIEWKVVCSTGGTGTQDLYVDGSGSLVALTSQTHAAAIGRGVIGTQDTLSTTTGTLLFDQFVFDDARVYPMTRRFPTDVLLTKSGHVAVGPCIIENVSLLSGAGTDCVLSIYDTDTGNTNDASKVSLELKNVTASDIVDPAGMPLRLERGCYVAMSGTTPRAMVKLGWAPAYGSDGAIRTYGSKRKALPGDI